MPNSPDRNKNTKAIYTKLSLIGHANNGTGYKSVVKQALQMYHG